MKYNIIYADPPWFYSARNNKSKFGHGANQYKLMTNKDIIALDIGALSADNCACFLWVTMPNLQVGLDCLKSWGFVYKTVAFAWIKTNKNNKNPFFGVGYYTKSNAELCLLGVKGKMKPISNRVSSAIITPIREHSKKPDEARNGISELFGKLPSIELFTRPPFDVTELCNESETPSNWTFTGLECDGKDIKDFIKESSSCPI